MCYFTHNECHHIIHWPFSVVEHPSLPSFVMMLYHWLLLFLTLFHKNRDVSVTYLIIYCVTLY